MISLLISFNPHLSTVGNIYLFFCHSLFIILFISQLTLIFVFIIYLSSVCYVMLIFILLSEDYFSIHSVLHTFKSLLVKFFSTIEKLR